MPDLTQLIKEMSSENKVNVILKSNEEEEEENEDK